MQITEEILHRLGRDVCETMVEFPRQLADSPTKPTRWVSAFVTMQGLHRNHLEVIADEQLAAVIACTIFATPLGEMPSQSDMFDALGEIANQIGGNLKGIIGDEAELSLPVVKTLTSPDTHIATGTTRVTIEFADFPLTLVYQSSTPRTHVDTVLCDAV